MYSHDKNRDDLILRIYDTALDGSVWPDLLLEIAHFCNAEASFVFAMQGPADDRHINAMHYSSKQNEAVLNQYLELHRRAEIADQAYFANRSRNSDHIQMITDEELIKTNGGDAFFESPHMQMQLSFGFKHRAGALLNKDDFFRDRIALVYGQRYGPPSADDVAAAESILPHLAKALDVSRPAVAARDELSSMIESIDALNVGICVLDNQQRVVFQNAEFSRQTDTYDAFEVDRTGQIKFNADRFDRAIVDLLGHHENHGKFGARPRKEAVASDHLAQQEFALCVEVLPLRKASQFGESSLDGHVIYSLDTSRSFTVRQGLISDLYGLTKSETEVLQLMAEGLTNSEMSDRRDKSIHTVNSQVKSILQKMQASNRTQLIRMVTNLSAGMRGK